jgi:hypothetical protein
MIRFETGIVLYANLMLVAGCAGASSRPMTLPNGRQGYVIRCHGKQHDIGGCMNTAGKICGGPYYIVNQNGQVVGGSDVLTIGGPVIVNGIDRTLIVQCERK